MDSYHDKAMDTAGASGDVEAARLAIRLGASDVAQAKALFTAVHMDHSDFVAAMFEDGLPHDGIYSSGGSLLDVAVKRGRLQICEMILARGTNLATDTKAMYYAAAYGWREIAALLVNYGANVNAEGEKPLHGAAKAGNAAMISDLLGYGADLTADHHQALHEVIDHGYQEALAVMVGHAGPQAAAPYAPLRKPFETLMQEIAALPPDARKGRLFQARGDASQDLRHIAAARLLPGLFEPCDWQGQEPEALELLRTIKDALPDFLQRHTQAVDTTPFLLEPSFRSRIKQPDPSILSQKAR